MNRALNELESSQFFLLEEAQEYLLQAVPNEPGIRRATLKALQRAWCVGFTTDGQALYSQMQLDSLIDKVRFTNEKITGRTRKRMQWHKLPTVWSRLGKILPDDQD